MDCARCGRPPLEHERYCAACASDVGFPNVRFASRSDEKVALLDRAAMAREAARSDGSITVLEDFAEAVNGATVVMVRHLVDLQRVLKHDNQLFVTFHRQLASGQRLPEENAWDPARDAVESTINPLYYRDIQYAALSLNGLGATAYGGYHITLRGSLIEHRTTLFEESPFHFCRRHQVIAGQPIPLGYRATWSDRSELAVAKLKQKISVSTEKEDFAAVLCDDGPTTGDVECIEAHIYGPIHRSTIAHVIGPKPSDPADAIIWQSVVGHLHAIGATVVER